MRALKHKLKLKQARTAGQRKRRRDDSGDDQAGASDDVEVELDSDDDRPLPQTFEELAAGIDPDFLLAWAGEEPTEGGAAAAGNAPDTGEAAAMDVAVC